MQMSGSQPSKAANRAGRPAAVGSRQIDGDALARASIFQEFLNAGAAVGILGRPVSSTMGNRSEAIRHILATVFSAQNALRELAPGYRWTGLGNLLGDYGEFVAIDHYGLSKAGAGASGYDATTPDGRTVQIKANHHPRPSASEARQTSSWWSARWSRLCSPAVISSSRPCSPDCRT